jgi:Retrotransposon gag protein
MHLRSRKIRDRKSSPPPSTSTHSPPNTLSSPDLQLFIIPEEHLSEESENSDLGKTSEQSEVDSEPGSESYHSSTSSGLHLSPLSLNSTMAEDQPPPEDTFVVSEGDRLVPTFGGKEKSFFRFLQLAEVAYEDVTSPLDEKKFLRMIFGKLDGDAFEIGRSQAVESWEDLKNVLQEAYGSPKTAAELLNELTKARQNGSVSEYGEYFRKRLVAMRAALESERRPIIFGYNHR